MNTRTDLNFVLRMRNEAAEILRTHGEATGRVGAASRAATRQIEVFRESLQQAAKGMTSLTGAVRVLGADVADSPALMPWTAAGADDLTRDFEAVRDVARERIARSIELSEPILVRRSRALDQVDEPVRGDRRTIAPPDPRSPAADDRVETESGGRRGHRDLREQQAYPRRDGRTVGAALEVPDLKAVSELTAAVDAVLRKQALLLRTHPTSTHGLRGIGLPGEAIEQSRWATIREQPMAAAGTFRPMDVTLGRDAGSSVEFGPQRWSRESAAQLDFDDSPFVTMSAAERRELVGDMHDFVASLSREVAKATAQAKEPFEIEGGRKDEVRVRELLRLELRRLAPTGREIDEVAADRGTWSREHRDAVVETVASRRPSTMTAHEWIGSSYPEGAPVAAHLRDVSAGWQAYGSGVASALGATDQALTGILTQTRDWRSAMHSLINSVVADFARIAIRQNVTGPLAETVLGGGRDGGNAGLLGRAFGWVTSLFAGGGVMTAHGPLPLHTYASGGIATSPQLALFGEGSTPEAYVPVPNGRIPVTLRGGGAGVGSIATNIVINVTGGGGGAGNSVVGSDPAEQARNIGAVVSAAFNRNLAEQMRPGGLLNPAGYLGNGLAH